jgi:hypothetical protein
MPFSVVINMSFILGSMMMKDYCRIKLSIPPDSLTWFCDDHIDMHKENDSFEQEQSPELIQDLDSE